MAETKARILPEEQVFHYFSHERVEKLKAA